jgi:predicted transcriptional regulator of viral defense system
MGDFFPNQITDRKMKTLEFFATHTVFSLDEASTALGLPGGRSGTVERLKYHVETGRLKLMIRGVYAVIPPGGKAEEFRPDPFLVAAAFRPEGVFSHHSALELQGVAHSVWNECTLYAEGRRRPLLVNGNTVRFLEHPAPMRTDSGGHLGTRKIERQGKLLLTTGPERTLVEGFRRPRLAGGLEELVTSASGFAVLDLTLLDEILQRYSIANLWAATGWFLERFRKTFHVPDEFLNHMEQHRPRSPHYLERNRRGGVLAARWNLILPKDLMQWEGRYEP